MSLATRVAPWLRADRARVLATLFVPGHAFDTDTDRRTSLVVDDVLGLPDAEAERLVAGILERFGPRHRELERALAQHADRLRDRIGPDPRIAGARELLLGATFTQETAVEPAAICNPSAFALPAEPGDPEGAVRFGLSVRQIGEGHRSTIGFRRGLIRGDGTVTIEPTGPYCTTAEVGLPSLDRGTFIDPNAPVDPHDVAVSWVLDELGSTFSPTELAERLHALDLRRDTMRYASEVARDLRLLASRAYTATFQADTPLAERVLVPVTSAESNGVEDARFVRFVEDDGTAIYLATYTAYDGHDIRQQLLSSKDLLHFHVTPLIGSAAENKGLALFPRRIGGRFVALSRSDGATNAVAFSDDLRHWSTSTPVAVPHEPWELVQIGNCGPPIETPEGWLVLTHGVGPMRAYSLGAWLLDLDDPTRLIGRLREPLLTPEPDEQDGYVPNVVYSCGSLLAGPTLLVPFGVGDESIRFATVPLGPLLDELLAGATKDP